MNQNALLQCIRRHIRESITDDGVARPLGEVVGSVFAEIKTTPATSITNSKVIPISWVAALVDGTLSDDEAKAVCQAAQTDQSVVAELVAAVRAQHEAKQSPPPLSNALNDRLLQMGASLSPPSDTRPVVATPTSPASVSIEVSQPTTTPAQRGSTSSGGSWKWIAGIAAVAATVLALIYLQNRPTADPQPGHQEVVKNPSVTPLPQPDMTPKSTVDPNQDEAMLDNPDHQPPRVVDVPDRVIPPTEGAPNRNAPLVESKPPSMVNQDNPTVVPPSDRPMFAPESVPPSRNTPKATAFAGLKWKRIHGILAAEQSIPMAADVSAARTSIRWNSITENTVSFNNTLGVNGINLRTLSFSRAEAELASGGRLVMRGETAADLTATTDASVDLDLWHGGIAMIDFPVDTIVNFRSQNRNVGRIHWSQPRSTVLAEYGRDGLVIHVQGNGVTVNERELTQPTVVVDDNRDLKPTATLKRLPTWVNRNVDAVEIPRTVLAQISGTNDLMKSMSLQIRNLAGKPRLTTEEQKTLALIARWQVTLGEANLFRLLSNKFAIVRRIALERLVDLPEWEPRYETTWSTIRRNGGNRTNAGRIERLCRMVRSGQQPTSQQIDQMIAGLDSPGLATRAMYDYLLRRIFGGGPNFDPTVTLANRRAAGIVNWRNYAAARQR